MVRGPAAFIFICVNPDVAFGGEIIYFELKGLIDMKLEKLTTGMILSLAVACSPTANKGQTSEEGTPNSQESEIDNSRTNDETTALNDEVSTFEPDFDLLEEFHFRDNQLSGSSRSAPSRSYRHLLAR